MVVMQPMAKQRGHGEAKTSPRRVLAVDRQRMALQLRASGATFDEIAAKLHYAGRSSAYHAVQDALEKTLREPAETLRTLELERLDQLQAALWSKAMGGDYAAV